MIEYIGNPESPMAVIVRSSYSIEGIKFLTPNSFSQQLGFMNRPRGYVIPPHVHNQVERRVDVTNEVLFIKRGSLRVDFYDEKGVYDQSKILGSGDVILLAFGGHGFEMLEDCEIIEVKQGPYAGENDKTRFDPVSQSQICTNKKQ